MATQKNLVTQANDLLAVLSETELVECRSAWKSEWDYTLTETDSLDTTSPVGILTPEDAALILSKYVVMIGLSSGVNPLQLVARIVNDVAYHNQLDNYPVQLRVFSGLLSQYEDFSDPVQIDYYGLEKCKETQADTVRKMTEELSKFVAWEKGVRFIFRPL